jgi:large subunit ribosomal protein L9
MEVILRTYVEHLGERGELVKVADGYARNYLLPRKLALLATEGNRKRVERERERMEAHEAEEKAQAEAIAARLGDLSIEFTRRVGDTEQLYGSVTSSDIAQFLKEQGFEIDRRKLVLPDPIKALGEHEVPLKLHRAVTVGLKVRVRRQGGELEAPTEETASAAAESDATE